MSTPTMRKASNENVAALAAATIATLAAAVNAAVDAAAALAAGQTATAELRDAAKMISLSQVTAPALCLD